MAINNLQDIIDSRDVIERIEELEDEFSICPHCGEGLHNGDGIAEVCPDCEQPTEFDTEELDALRSLAEEAEGYAADWQHGEALIRDSYFTEYAQELAEDCGMVSDDTAWPNNCIDWEQAAEELKQDYTCVSFDGVDYWIR
jgi:hypothetical protein